ncbi:TPA: hypothetical protein SLD83_001767 [Legionella pneumophila]|uniref:Uncharacterized protein n=1 Tax=Legionella bononiensis TaxID=2793102 RepID=A0ABS1WEX2_9GAMM|nr:MULTISPECIES: hypothetical protein [Legionellaceae]ERH41499.1 hypothetical protein N750_16335 [Legionella pneumophila str. Leg01/53]ERI48043.1 hypothetical protein N749_11460 [Legionella pneumophila str. Leg01/20]HAT9652023.1 hypothetical protein [Legionella pneumophila subsp. pneumophila]KTD12365.1 hypothetical protein Lhac_1236 [Legionella hackeliae]MBL7478700.1 hypothetical protein [Legionella bononiensis]
MNSTDKDKLKHDFLNSIVIINSMTKSASSFINTISQSMETSDINQKQMEKFLYSMSTIREQTVKIENYFLSLLNE